MSLTQARNGIANFLTSDQDRSRTILQKVLRPYINRSDRDFIKISRAATNSFFDYAVQTDQNLNMFLKSLLIDKDGTRNNLGAWTLKPYSDTYNSWYRVFVPSKSGEWFVEIELDFEKVGKKSFTVTGN